MTNEEAIECNKNLRMYMQITDKNSSHKFLEENYIALDMAIKALEQEPILDKIRAEISALMPPLGNWMYDEGHIVEQTACEVIADVLQIIDKYKTESEE